MNYRYILIMGVASLVFLVILGIPTAIIPNPFYIRMISATYIDWTLLFIVSIMLGIYSGLYFYGKSLKQKDSKGDGVAGSSAIASFFALSCPVCISFLVAIFGTTALLTYYEPLRHPLGVITIGLLGASLYLKSNAIKGCKGCNQIKDT